MSKTVKRKKLLKDKQALAWDISEIQNMIKQKNEQGQLEERIAKLEMILRNAKLIDDDEITTDVVSIGSKVVVKILNMMRKWNIP